MKILHVKVAHFPVSLLNFLTPLIFCPLVSLSKSAEKWTPRSLVRLLSVVTLTEWRGDHHMKWV